MDKRARKLKSGLSEKKKLAELLADAAKAKTTYKWDQAIEMYTHALETVNDLLRKASKQTLAQRDQLLHQRFEILDQRRICYRDRGDFRGEEADLGELATLANEMSDAARQTRVMTAQARLYWLQGRVEEARQMNEVALTQAQQLRDRLLEADALVNLALLTWRSKEQSSSKRTIERALELHRELGDLSGTANDLRMLGMVYYDFGESANSWKCYEEALEIFRQMGDRLGEGNTLNSMQIASPDLARRRDLCEQALTAFEAAGNLERMAMMYNNIGFDYTFLGLYERSLEYLQRSYELSHQMGAPVQLAYALSSLGSAYIGLGDTQKARPLIEQSLSIAREVKDRALEAGELLELGRIELIEGHPGEALLAIQTTNQIFQEYGSIEQAAALAWKGAAHLMLGELEAAQQATSQAVEAFEKLGPPNENLPQEVWWWRYQCLSRIQQKPQGERKGKGRKTKEPDEVWLAIDCARQAMLTPIATLSDDGLRRNYFDKIRINRQIVQKWFEQARRRNASLEPLTSALVGPGDGQDQFRRLLDIGVRLNARGEVSDLPTIILNEVVELTGAERAIFYLIDEEGKPHMAAEHLPPSASGGYEIEARRSQYLDEIMLKRVPRLLYDPQEADSIEQQSILCTPLIANGKLVGLFYCEISGIYGRFTNQDRDLLSVLANQAAVAVENANWTNTLEQRVAERTAELTIINSVGEAMARQLDVETITHIVGDKVRDIFQAETVGILFYDSKTDMIQEGYIYDRGYSPLIPPFPLGKGLTSTVVQSRQPLVLGTSKEAEEHGAIIGPNALGEEGITQSYIGVPIIVGERVVGVVSVQSYRPHAFDEASVRLLSTLSTNMGVAIENARLFQAESQRAAELAIINSVQQGLASQLDMQAIYDLVGEKIREIFDAQIVFISTLDQKTKLSQLRYVIEKGERYYPEPAPYGKIAEHIIQTRQPMRFDTLAEWDSWESIIVPGTENTKSGVYVPLVVGNEVKGIISLQNIDHENAFNDSDVRLLQTLANSMSVALENARLFDETQRLLKESEQRATELSIINEIQQGLAAELDFQAIVDLVGDKLSNVFKLPDIGIYWHDEKTHLLHYLYAIEHGQRLNLSPRPPQPGGVFETIVKTRQPVVLNAVEEYAKFGMGVIPGTDQSKSMVSVPIISSDRVLGLISMEDYERENAYGEPELRLLTTIAASLGSSLENAHLFAETQRLLKETEQRKDELAILNSVGEAMAKTLDVKTVTHIVGDKVRDIFDTDAVAIMLHDPKTNLIHTQYEYDKGEGGYVDYVEPFTLGTGLTSKIIASRQPLLLGTSEEQQALGAYLAPELLEQGSSITTQSWLGVPIIVGDKVLGVVMLSDYEPNAYNENHVRLLQTLSSNMGVAIENARLFDETQRLLKETEQRKDELAILNSVGEAMARTLDVKTVTRIVGDKVRDIFDADVVGILLLEAQTNLIHNIYEYDKGEGGYLDYIEPIPLGTGLTSKVIASRQPLLLGTVEQQAAEGAYLAPESLIKGSGVITQSWLGVPIIVGERVLGVVVLSDYDPYAYNENHVRLLQTLSANMGVAIENARLFQAEQERIAELAIINSVQASLAAELNIQGIYDTVGDKIREIFHHTDLNIRIYDPKTNLEHFPYVYENGKRITIPPDPLPEKGISAHVIRTRETLVINENMAQAVEEYASYTMPGTMIEKSAVYVPLIVGDQARGLINLTNVEREHAFTESDVRLLQTLANSMSVALENARLFDETQRLLEETRQNASELAIINRVSMALARQLDPEAIVSLVGEKLSEVFAGQMCSIALYDKITDLIHWPYFIGFDGRQIPQEPVPIGPGLTSHVVRSRQPLVLGTLQEAEPYGAVWVYDEAEREPKSWIGVPILMGDEAIGVLAIQDLPEHRYGEDDVRLLATLAASTGVALENARLFSETKRLLAESEQRASELTTINTVSQALTSKLELDSLIELIGEQMRQVFKADVVYVALHDPQTNFINFPYAYGDELSPIEYGEGLTSKVLEAGKPLLINRSVEERTAELGATRVGTTAKSYLGVPILVGKQPIGVISVQSLYQEGRFSDSDVHLLSTIAANVGAAIQNARLYQETQRRAVEMAALAEIGSDIASTHEIEPVLERLAARTKELLNVGDIALYLLQPDGETMRAAVVLGKYAPEIKANPLYIGKGIVGSIAQSGAAEFVNYPENDSRTIHIPGTPSSEEEPEGIMCAPLISRGKVIGLMTVWRLRTLGLFTQLELDFLVSLARQAAIAIESARLYMETQRRADQMATIAEVGRELSATLDLQAVLESVGNHVHRLFKARDTILRLVEPDGKTLRSVVALGIYTDQFISDLIPLGEGITGSIAQSGIAEVIDDVSRDARGIHVSGTPEQEEEPETLMVAPLMSRDRTIGVLSVYRNRREGLFTPVDLDFLVGLCRQASISIENARLFAEVQSQKQFSEFLVENIPVAIVTTDMDVRIASWNPAAEDLFGYTREEALGSNLDDLVANDETLHAEAISFFQEAATNRLNAITRRTRKDGSLVDVELSGVSLAGDGQDVGIIAIYHDISEIKRAEAAILESERRLADIINFLPDATLVIDREGRVIAWNRAMEQMTGIKTEDILGKGDYEYALPFYGDRRPILVDLVFSTPEELEGKYIDVQRQGATLVGETYVSHLKGGGRYLLGTASVLHDSRGQLVGAIEIVRDITDRKRMEDELRRAKGDAEAANQAKSAFLAMMSHEIRTPMNAIIGMSGLLMDTPLTPEQSDFAETIRSSGDALLTIINDILDFSKIEASKMELEEQPFDLRECLEASIDLIKIRASEKALELAYQMELDVPPAIVGDVTRLRQILINLLNNAVKFTENGEVVLSVEVAALTPSPSPAKGEGTYSLHFSVRDTGIGIPPDQLERLFQAFSQADASTSRRYGGTGLGLAISKRLSELMGGKMWVESEGIPGKGSTFHFSITAQAAAELKARPHLSKEQPALKGKRLLIVDDNATNRRILTLQTKTWGMISRDSATPQEALAWLQKGDPFDLAVLDMHMPAMDGLQLAREIRKLRSEKILPLVLISSIGRSESGVPEGLFSAYLMKPIRPSALFDTMMNLFAAEAPKTEEVLPVQPRLDPEMASRRPLRILLAEDNAVNQKLALRLLSQMGYRADVAANGLETIRSLERQPYDVILMDVQMPEMDGLEASRQICARWPRNKRPRIVAMTANAMQGDREKCLEAGMDDYVSKPIRVEELVRALSEATPVKKNE